MKRKDSVKYAINTMEMEGFTFTPEEKAMWNQIGTGELPPSVARAEAEEFDRSMKEKYPEKYAQGDE